MTKKLTSLEEKILREHFTGEKYLEARKKLDKHIPLAYVVGEWYFWDGVFRLNEQCLIPRPETEHAVEYLVNNLPQNACFADLCTGCGCIAISVLRSRTDCTAYAVDISDGALECARYNAETLGVADRIEIIRSDVFDTSFMGERIFDAIVSNPPYIETEVIKTLEDEVKHEPKIALDGGADGLNFYRLFLAEYGKYIKPSGFMALEIGYNQGEQLKEMRKCEIIKDYSGNDRIAVIRQKDL